MIYISRLFSLFLFCKSNFYTFKILDVSEIQAQIVGIEDKRTDHSTLTSGQSYKHFTSINYDPRVVIWAIWAVLYYDRKVLYKMH